jgi:hypothetical protein
MRFISKVSLCALLAALAVGALAGSASAVQYHACVKNTKSTHDYACINGGKEYGRLGSESTSESESLKSQLVAGTHVSVEWKLGGEVLNLTCEAMNGKGSLTSGGNPMVQLSAPTIEFMKCAETGKEKRCTVERFTLPENGHTGGSKDEPALVQDILLLGEPRSGELVLRNGTKTCVEAGTHELSSEIPCTVTEVEVEKLAKEMACKGNLITREQDISISFEAVMELSGANAGKKFSIYQGT